MRLQRLLSSFIEAEGVTPVTSGGVKLDRVDPTGTAAEGYGNVPFSRTEFVVSRLTAYANLDLATMHGYGLGEAANHLLIALALYKLLAILERGLRLRTACDLEVRALTVTRPAGIALDARILPSLEQQLPALIAACDFGPHPVTHLTGQTAPRRSTRASRGSAASEPQPEGEDA